MSNNDLRQMKLGVMDQTGEGTTKLARIIGIMATFFGALSAILAIVLAALLISGSIVIASFTDILATSKEDAAKTQLQMFELPLNNYQMHVGQYPSTESGLEALRTPPNDGNLQQKWRGPYLQKTIPTDPWGNPYNYANEMDPQTNRPGFRIWSFGADMSSGTDDDIIITSYE